uniref:KH domain-containing protein n=1 Tax=Angiostrongylus cantonensis TaxID=6313 RepID=A0A0K0DDR1_ANGCA
MQPRLAGGNQATESVELIRHGTTGDSSAALVDQLVLEFLCMELNEPPAAHLAKMAGDGAQLQFISNMFDHNPILEQLAASAVSQLGAAMQRNLPNQHENRDESIIPVRRTQQLRLLYLIREVLERRNILSQNVTTQAKQHRSIETPTTHTVLQQEMKSTSVLEHCEHCGNKKQSTYQATLTQNVPTAQNPDGLIAQHESKPVKAPSNKVGTTPVARQQRQVVRTSKIMEKTTESHVTMSVKIYIPSPPPGVKCSYIGRLIGPNGITIRELQLETRCHIAVRGRGSIKDNKLFRKMRYKPGFGHLKEDTHVLVEAKASSRTECRSLIEKAKTRISEMFTPEFDALKREQLIHLAMLNGTYRQTMPSTRPT